MEEQFGKRCWRVRHRARVLPTRSIDLFTRRKGLVGNHDYLRPLLHTSKFASTNSKSEASSRMHRGSCITRRKSSARKTCKPHRTSHCQRPHKHAEQLLLSRIQSHAEGDESAKRQSSIGCPTAQKRWAYTRAKEEAISTTKACQMVTEPLSRKQPPPWYLWQWAFTTNRRHISNICTWWISQPSQMTPAEDHQRFRRQ